MIAVPNIRLRCGSETDLTAWHPDAVAFYGYWQRISPPGSLPGRQHFDPVDLGRLLPAVSLYDVHRYPLRYRCRVSSTRTVQMMSKDVTGRWLDEAVSDSPARSLLFSDLEVVAVEGVALYKKRLSSLRADIRPLLVENVTVPLARDGKMVDMVASLTVWATDQGRIGPRSTF